jgi:hypothetical protein
LLGITNKDHQLGNNWVVHADKYTPNKTTIHMCEYTITKQLLGVKLQKEMNAT